MSTFAPCGFSRLILVAVAIAIGAGCAQAQTAAPATPADSPVKNLLKLGNFATDPAPAKDFVVKSRPAPDKLDYLPVHARPATRPGAIYTPAQAKAKEAELDQLRFAHDRLANRPTASLAPAADKKKPARAQVKPPSP